jgi:hypothetical protein
MTPVVSAARKGATERSVKSAVNPALSKDNLVNAIKLYWLDGNDHYLCLPIMSARIVATDSADGHRWPTAFAMIERAIFMTHERRIP